MAQTAYWVIGPSTGWTDPTGAEIRNGQLSGGGAATASGSESAPGSGSGTITEATAASGLTAGQSYKLAWVVHDSVALTYSNVAVSATFTTAIAVTVGQALQTDTAQALAAAQSAAIGQAQEVDTAQAVSPSAPGQIAQAQETDLAQPLQANQALTIGQATQADTAQAFTVGGTGAGASAADVWSYVLSNGLTAEQTLVAVHTWLSELHLIHGLTSGSPLSVSTTSRTAGAVSQTVAEAGGTVTVTRQ